MDRAGGYDPRKLTERRFTQPFPIGTIVTPLYVDHAGFAGMPKPDRYRAFFVMRDPRDVVVSWYFSLKGSHNVVGDIGRVRSDLLSLPSADGLCYAIDYLRDFGLFEAQRSWAGVDDPAVLLVRHEDLTGHDSATIVQRVLTHCDIRMPRPILNGLLRDHSFERLSGRQPGEEDAGAHYRKGVAGDWRNHFDARVCTHFAAAAADVVRMWGYQE